MFSFGDEASALSDGTQAPRGYTWSVNGLDDQGAFDCRIFPIWIQRLASIYQHVYAECNLTTTEAKARTWAVAGAKVRDVQAQIDAQVQAGGVRDKDLATLFIGTNDIFELYAQYPQRSEQDLVDEAMARGKQAGALANQLITLGAKVIVSYLPDLSFSPFARKEQALNKDTDRAALIYNLTQAFNLGLGVQLLPDGRYVGLVAIYGMSMQMKDDPGYYGLWDVSQVLCTVALPNCTTATMAPEGAATTWLWADDRWFSPGGHSQMANLAIDRALKNPF
jgi:phospholipase/lecithinase/hemolysin